jgi:GTP diphosphokinase / guanosine-3',5'-bis(diphosphate) 3'-diphosphatase
VNNAIESVFRACHSLTKKERLRLERSIEIGKKAHEGQIRKSDGSPYFIHPLSVAEILCRWGADCDTVIAGILHDTVEDSSLTIEDIEDEFGLSVASLVEGVTKFTKIDLKEKDLLSGEVETLRKLFEVMRTDIRVFIIKIADRIHNLRTIKGLSDERRISFAKESLDIYYKIAYHLGMGEVCREITNICIPYVYPEKAKIRDKFWKDQKKSVSSAVEQIDKSLQKEMEKKQVVEVQFVKSSHDIPRVNNEDESEDRAYYCVIIAKDEDGCYNAFKALHSLYRPVRRKFHDYIASPPESGYRSLHTTIIGPHDKQVQVRIRTQEMDIQNRFGVLKTAFGSKDGSMKEFSWLERSAELDRTTRESSEAFWDALQSDIFQKSIEVTVNGDVVSVPLESTALDAVYFHIGAKAHAVSGIKINGHDVELSTILHPDDVVEVAMEKVSSVQFHWLDLVTTKYARNHIVEALKEFDSTERFELGQQLLQKELDHFQKILVGEISKYQQKIITDHFKRETFEDVIVMIGEGVVQPREIVSLIQKKKNISKTKGFHFRLVLEVTDRHREDILPQISALARIHNVQLENVHMNSTSKHGMITVKLRGFAQNKSCYADFLSALERHSWVSRLQTMISIRQRAALIVAFCIAFAVLIAQFILLAQWKDWLVSLPGNYAFFLEVAFVIPPLVANFYILRMLRHFVVAMRNDRWFLVMGSVLNIAVCSLLLYESVILGFSKSILPLVVVFIFFMIYIGYRFIITERLFAKVERATVKPLTKKQWQKLRRQKIAGYTFRLGAVIIWGIQPLYLRYTPANEVSPFIRVFLTGIGVLIITGLFIGIKKLRSTSVVKKVALPKNILLTNIIIGYILFTYLINASLQFTTSTNFILFNNFSPVIALLVGAMLWRSSIPYLRDPRKMMWVFVIFLMGSTGAALIIYNTMKGASGGSLYGDTLGLLAMAADTVLVVSQIRYMKLYKNISSLSINLYVFASHIIAIAPLMLWFVITKNPNIVSLTLVPVMFGIGAGILAGIGQILNYETFRRIDGFIAFLMFNVSILITFVVEVFFLGQFKPSWILLIGGAIVIASTVLAELINTHCQKRGL